MTNERIAVGIDFSEASQDAARWVAGQFPDAEIVLVHVIAIPEPPPIVGNRYPRRDLMIDTLREGADKRLRTLADAMQAQRVWLEVREGEVVPVLAEIASAYGASFVAVGAHGERPRRTETIGTTAQQVVRTAEVPVLLIVRPHESRLARLLVPVEDTTAGGEALRWAARLSRPSGAHVNTLHVTASGVMTSALTAAAVISGVPAPSVPHTDAPPPADRWTDLAVASGVDRSRVASEEVFGDAATEILAASERLPADLIIMSRRKAGGLRRAVLGSVTEAVLRHATCNVLIVPETP